MLRTNVLIAASLAALVSAAPAGAAGEDGFRLLLINGQSVKWGMPQPGTGATITYAIAEKDLEIRGSYNCRKTAGIGGLLTRSGISRTAFDDALEQAFRMWSDVADVRFVPAQKGTTADITIAAETVSDGVAYSDVTLTSAPQSKTIARAIVCLNPAIDWSGNADTADSYRLFYVLAHEIGHTIGLDHPNPSGEVMSFEYSRTIAQLQPGDVAGIRSLYGAAQNKSIASIAPQH